MNEYHYFVSYAWKDEHGNSGFSSMCIDTDQLVDHVESLVEITEDIKLNVRDGEWKLENVTILNFQLLRVLRSEA